MISFTENLKANKIPISFKAKEDEEFALLKGEFRSQTGKRHAIVERTPLLPKDYFIESEFWSYGPTDAMENWDYCLSRLETKTKILWDIYIGSLKALVNELCKRDFSVKSNEYNAKHDPSLHLLFKNEKDKDEWQQISDDKFGVKHPEVPFTRVISVVKDEESEANLSAIVRQAGGDSGYALFVKEHFCVRLLDLPKDQEEKEKQSRQWAELVSNFPIIFKMIDSAREERAPILIHCTAGRHRSAAILTAYLAYKFGLTVKESMDYVRNQRSCVIEYEKSEFTENLEALFHTK